MPLGLSARRPRGPRRPPGPRGQPFVGDLDAYQADRLGWLRRAHCEYGDLVRITPSMTVVNHPEVAHEILADTNDRFLLDTATLAGRRHRAAQTRRLADWMRLRRRIWHGFADRLESAHLARFDTLARSGLRELAPAADDAAATDGRPDDLVTACRRLCGRMIVDFCLGGDPADSGDLVDTADRANALFLAGLDVLSSGETRLPLLPKPRASAASSANAALIELLGHRVSRRRAADWGGEPRDLLDALLVGTGPADHEMVVRALRTAMFASHGVPGAALAWIVLRLAAHPDVAARVAEEAAPCRGGAEALGRRPELAQPYTSAVVAETLRLHPPQWLLSRVVQSPTEVGGYRLRAGHELLICPYLIHRDPRWWERAGEFDPGRWPEPADGGSERPRRTHARHAYLPFGAGPRICPGSALARTQLTLLAGLLARDHALEGLPAPETVDVTCEGLLLPDGVRGGWRA